MGGDGGGGLYPEYCIRLKMDGLISGGGLKVGFYGMLFTNSLNKLFAPQAMCGTCSTSIVKTFVRSHQSPSKYSHISTGCRSDTNVTLTTRLVPVPARLRQPSDYGVMMPHSRHYAMFTHTKRTSKWLNYTITVSGTRTVMENLKSHGNLQAWKTWGIIPSSYHWWFGNFELAWVTNRVFIQMYGKLLYSPIMLWKNDNKARYSSLHSCSVVILCVIDGFWGGLEVSCGKAGKPKIVVPYIY